MVGGGARPRAHPPVPAAHARPSLPPPKRPLQELVLCLSSRLADIVARSDGGRLAAAGVGPRDAARLVEALFEDTPARRAALARVRAGPGA